MSITAQQYQNLLTRATRIENAINDIFVALDNYITRSDMNQLLVLLQTELEQLQEEVDNLDIVGASTTAITTRIGLEKLFNIAYLTQYAELSYVGDNLTQIDIWEDNTKALKLFTRALSYTGDNLTEVVTMDEVSNDVLTVTLTYSGDDLDTVTKVVS